MNLDYIHSLVLGLLVCIRLFKSPLHCNIFRLRYKWSGHPPVLSNEWRFIFVIIIYIRIYISLIICIKIKSGIPTWAWCAINVHVAWRSYSFLILAYHQRTQLLVLYIAYYLTLTLILSQLTWGRYEQWTQMNICHFPQCTVLRISIWLTHSMSGFHSYTHLVRSQRLLPVKFQKNTRRELELWSL